MTSHEEIRRFIDELWVCLSESKQYHAACEKVRNTIEQTTAVVARLRRRLAARHRRYVVALVGATNVGKSTLLNSLFGEEADIAPRRNGPCTAIPVEFEFSPSPEIVVEYRDDFRPMRTACDSTAELSQRLRDLADDSGADAGREYRRVVVRLPNPLLEGMVLVDTPGFGAVQDQEAAGAHEQALVEYLQNDPARVVWLTTAIGGLGDRELTFYRRYLEDLCDDIVLTKCSEDGEAWSQRDSSRFERRYGKVFGRKRPRFHFTSAMEGMGVDSLRDHLRATADQSAWLQDFVEQLKQLCADWADWFSTVGDGLVPHRLRPDSLLRLQAGPACAGVRERLIELLAGKVRSNTNIGQCDDEVQSWT